MRVNTWLFWLAATLWTLYISSPSIAQSVDSFDTSESDLRTRFVSEAQQFLSRHCIRCHGDKVRESGVRVDTLDDSLADSSLGLWDSIRKQVESGAMPPEAEAPHPGALEKDNFLRWIRQALHVARSRNVQRNGAMRRLTVAQYRNTLRELLGIEENLTAILSPDAVSKDGFTNNAQTMLLSPLQIEAYFQIAERALDLAIVDEKQPPTIEAFQMQLGRSINQDPCRDKLILGANNLLLANEDFVVTEARPSKPFPYRPFTMERSFRFIEGYQGNDTVRQWREFDSIYHAVFACMRGSEGYPKGLAYETVRDGLLLRPAIPSPEIFGESNTYGPHANFKVSLRELPDTGRFRVTISAAKYNDGLLLDDSLPSVTDAESIIAKIPAKIPATSTGTIQSNVEDPHTVSIPDAGIYQIDVVVNDSKSPAKGKKQSVVTLNVDDRTFSAQATHGPLVAVRLPQAQCNSRRPSPVIARSNTQSFVASNHRIPWRRALRLLRSAIRNSVFIWDCEETAAVRSIASALRKPSDRTSSPTLFSKERSETFQVRMWNPTTSITWLASERLVCVASTPMAATCQD